MDGRPLVGVLALQGDFEAHAKILERLGASAREVRSAADLDGLDALIIPGGESTVMTLGIEREGLAEPLRELAAAGTPILGTCAGMIMLDRDHLGVLDVLARAATRSAASCTRSRPTSRFDRRRRRPGPRGLHPRAVDRRARRPASRCSPRSTAIPVAVRQGNVLALSFHPELSGETRLHQLLLERVGAARAAR